MSGLDATLGKMVFMQLVLDKAARCFLSHNDLDPGLAVSNLILDEIRPLYAELDQVLQGVDSFTPSYCWFILATLLTSSAKHC